MILSAAQVSNAGTTYAVCIHACCMLMVWTTQTSRSLWLSLSSGPAKLSWYCDAVCGNDTSVDECMSQTNWEERFQLEFVWNWGHSRQEMRQLCRDWPIRLTLETMLSSLEKNLEGTSITPPRVVLAYSRVSSLKCILPRTLMLSIVTSFFPVPTALGNIVTWPM